jgi:indole-3-glycerol phosphate synthase
VQKDAAIEPIDCTCPWTRNKRKLRGGHRARNYNSISVLGSWPFSGPRSSIFSNHLSRPLHWQQLIRPDFFPYNLEFIMPVSLDQIVAATRIKVAESRRSADVPDLEKKAHLYSPRGFRRALEAKSQTGTAIIAELKKASPSRGLIRANFEVELLAVELEKSGATALSVLTDEEFFQGSLENLRRASSCTQLPCLRKDFIVDEFQVLEARANSADAILLIVAALSQTELISLSAAARKHGLDVLCEAHDETELHRALDAGCDLIGVNSRDLRTFKVDLDTTLRLGDLIPKHVLRVAESGIHTGADIARLRAAGYQAFLIGESLMKSASPGEALRTLLAEANTQVGSF